MSFIEVIRHIDLSVFLFLNGLHSPFFDVFMSWATKPVVWLPLFLVLLFLTIREFRWKTLLIVVSAALLITLSDQLSNVSKRTTQRLRPSQDASIQVTVHTVDGYRGGLYGFYSGHASSTMALAVFLVLLFRGRYRWLAPVIFSWAVLMAYTRIYLGVHYPGDILAGMAAGALIGWGISAFCRWLLGTGTVSV
jgi:undecaprenyl-diphosphatase